MMPTPTRIVEIQALRKAQGGNGEKGDRSNLCAAPKGRSANWTCPLFLRRRQPAVDETRRQQRQRRIGRQQIMRQLRLAERPEHKPRAEPARASSAAVAPRAARPPAPLVLYRFFLPQSPNRVDQRRPQKHRPGKEADTEWRESGRSSRGSRRGRPSPVEGTTSPCVRIGCLKGPKIEVEEELLSAIPNRSRSRPPRTTARRRPRSPRSP